MTRTVFILATAMPFALSAQSVSPPAAPSGSTQPSEEIVELNPFTVAVGNDRSYQAQSSLGGGRLKANLKDIATPTTAFTQQFLEDLAVTSLDDLAPFMLSTEYDFGEDANGQNRLNGFNRPLRVRGLNGGTITLNFFKSSFPIDTFLTERVDQVRGPNSILFGLGDPGGIINVSSKRAVLRAPSGAVTFQGLSHAGQREEFDFNTPLLRDRLAVRLAAARRRTGSWRNYEYADEDRFYATVKWRIARGTELNVDLEQADIDKATKRTYTAYDAYTNWVAAGRPISATASAARAIASVSPNVPRIVYDSAAGTLVNWRNTTSSATRTSVDGDTIALADFQALPRETAIYGPGFAQHLGYTRLSAYLTHSFTRDLNLELAALHSDSHSVVSDPQLAESQILKVDTQPTLPTGGPNPNAGRGYFDAIPQRNYTDSHLDSLRATLAWQHDLGRWGRHTLAGVGQYTFGRTTGYSVREQIVSANAPTPTTAENNNNRVWRRTYVDVGGPSEKIVMANYQTQDASGLREPLSGQTYTTAWIPFNLNTRRNRDESTTAIAMLQSSFWRDRIHTVIGGSRDRRDDYISTQARTPLAGFTQGILYAVRNPDAKPNRANNVSFSGVLHATPWLSLTYSRAENSSLPSTGVMNAPQGGLTLQPPSPRGRSTDIGFKLDLLDHRLFLTAVRFETSANRDFDFVNNMQTVVNTVWNALDAAGALAANGIVYADVSAKDTGSTFDSVTTGYEVELTANLTPSWRLFANYSREETARANIGQEQRAYLANFRPLWLRYAGVPLVDGSVNSVAQGVAAIDAAEFTNFTLADHKRPLGQIRDKFNLRTNYDFAAESLKGFSAGGGLRYLGRPVIGFAATGNPTSGVQRTAYFGSEQVFVDVSTAYRRKLTAFGRNVNFSLQLNVNNALNNDAFVRLREASDHTLVNYRFNPPREWVLTTRFAF